MDWSHLHTLNLGWPNTGAGSVLGKLSAADLPSLKNLTFSNRDSESQTAVFGLLADTTRPLEAISLQSMNFDALESLVDILCEHHSSDLRSLSIHQAEREWGPGSNSILSLNGTELAKLAVCLKSLEHLQIDVNRAEPRTSPSYTALASSPSLSSLSIHFPSPDLGVADIHDMLQLRELNGLDDVIDHLVNQTSVQALHRDLRRRKVGNSLENLEVVVGE